MVKVQETGGQFFITIPREYVAQLKWAKGDVVTVSFNERGNLELKRVE